MSYYVFHSDATDGEFYFTEEGVLADNFMELANELGHHGTVTLWSAPEGKEFMQHWGLEDVVQTLNEMDWDAVEREDWGDFFQVLSQHNNWGVDELIDLSNYRSDTSVYEFEDDEALAQHYVDEGIIALPDSFSRAWVDWETMGKELASDYNVIEAGGRTFYLSI